ncbi:MAG: murein biosynthesis integral membrane protein MurJ [Pseudomonadota bacterium]
MNKALFSRAGIVSGATLISRILGFVRDAVIAMLLGAGWQSDMFFWVFRIPELFRKCFSDGILNLSFVPVFTRTLEEKGKAPAFDLARAAFVWSSALATVLVIAGMALAPAIVGWAEPGFAQDSGSIALTVLLSRIMMPYVVCVTVLALCMGVLNVLDHFAAPALAPMILNLSIIAAAVWLSPQCVNPPVGLALGVLCGGIIQVGFQVPFLWRSGFFRFFRTRIFQPDLLKAGKQFFPAVVGAAVYPINILTGTWMGGGLPEGSISYIYYADRLVQFPLALFAMSISIVLLPELSKSVVANDVKKTSALFAQGMKLVFSITLPAMAGLAVLRQPVVSLLFCQGAFDKTAVSQTATVLLLFSSGLWAFSGSRLFVTLYHAFSNTRPPFIAGTAAIGINVFLCLWLAPILGHVGIAISIVMASVLHFGLLCWGAMCYLNRESRKEIIICACRSVFVSAIMGLVVIKTADLMSVYTLSGKMDLFLAIGVCILAGITVYGLMVAVVGKMEKKLLFLVGRR